MNKINGLWEDIMNGNIPILFDSENIFQNGISPISKYNHYDSDETRYYDLSIMGVTADFFKNLDIEVGKGIYKKYDISDEDGDLGICAKKAWQQAWNDQKLGLIQRSYTEDYESSVPAQYSKDGKAHCFLYIAINETNKPE